MFAKNTKLLGAALVAAAALSIFAALFMLQFGVNLAYATNQIAPNVILTEVVQSTCQITLSVSALTFGNVIAWTNTVTTTNAVTDTNNGNAGTFMGVYGSNWIGPNGIAPNFGVKNTTWSGASTTGYGSANALTLISANTNLAAGASGGTATIYFGLGIPQGQSANTYTQNIIITNVC